MNDFSGVPATMRAAVMYDVDDIRIEERPVPALAPGDALVRLAASGVCSGDLMPWYVRKKAPFVFGHEPSGTIVAFGGGAPARRDGGTFALGDRVFAHHHAPCFACEACVRGAYVQCATWRGTALDPGGMAEYVRVPYANLADTLPLPPALGFADGSLVEPLACVVKSLRRAFPRELAAGVSLVPAAARPLAGATAYVIGAGVMGAMHVALATALGATVYASDFLPARRALAVELGAAAAWHPDDARAALAAATGDRFARVVICGPGSPVALAHAVDTVATDGTVLMFTPIAPSERFAFDQSRAYFRDVRLVSSYSCGPDDTRDSLAAIAAGIVTAVRLGATPFAFPAVADAYAAMARTEVLKAIVTFE